MAGMKAHEARAERDLADLNSILAKLRSLADDQSSFTFPSTANLSRFISLELRIPITRVQHMVRYLVELKFLQVGDKVKVRGRRVIRYHVLIKEGGDVTAEQARQFVPVK